MTARSILDSIAELALVPAAAPTVDGLLAATERWPSDQLGRAQLLRVARLVEHARIAVPHYAELPPPPPTPTAEWLRDLPLLDRTTALACFDDLASRAPPPGHRVFAEANTSGSTGRHVTVRVDAVTRAVGAALARRAHRRHRRDVRLKAAAIRAVTEDDASTRRVGAARWASDADAGPLVVLDAHTPIERQLAWLLREDPSYLATYPSNCAALIDRSEERGLRLPRLREVGTLGETIPDGLREACRRVWGVPLVDTYSSVETGRIADQCSETDLHHVEGENVLVEILRDDGSPAPPGELGRVVVTPLHSFVMPLLRYDIGDLAAFGAPCPCGRGLPVLQRIAGRFRNMMVLPSGDRSWPRFGTMVIGKRFSLRQFRLVQRSRSALVLEVVTDARLDGDEEARLRATVLDTVGHPFELRVEYVADIPRSPSGKFEDFVCEVEVGEPRPGQNSQ